MSPIMLTAWAVGKVPSLQIDGYRESSIEGLDRVTCRTADDSVITISSPTTAAAAQVQDREHAAGRLLSAGVRERLGFSVPHTLAAGLMETRRVVVTEEVQGTSLASMRDIKPALPSLAQALAKLHSLPTNIVKKGSIPINTSLDCLRDAAGIIDQAHQTTRVPSQLLDRWDAAIEDTELWQFTPTITHGDLEIEDVLVDGNVVTGIVKWGSASVGDPAVDVKAVVGPTPPEVSAPFVEEYLASRGATDRRIAHRARFLAELDIAGWLVHAVETHNEANVDEAVSMLTSLLASVSANPAMSLGAAAPKPINLVVDSPFPAVDESAFEDDAPTRVAEPVAEAAPTATEPVAPTVTNAKAVVDESESSRTEAGGRPGEVIIDAEVEEIQSTIVETFFSSDEKPPRRDDGEIL
jgi:macrolide phosphotransferase